MTARYKSISHLKDTADFDSEEFYGFPVNPEQNKERPHEELRIGMRGRGGIIDKFASYTNEWGDAQVS